MTAVVATAGPTVADVLLALGAIGERVRCAGCGATAASLGADGWKVLLRTDGGAATPLCPACLPALPWLLRAALTRGTPST